MVNLYLLRFVLSIIISGFKKEYYSKLSSRFFSRYAFDKCCSCSAIVLNVLDTAKIMAVKK